MRSLPVLARLKTPLVRGQWVEVNPEAPQEALIFWKKRQEGTATVRELLRMAIGAEQVSPTLELEGVEASGWVGGSSLPHGEPNLHRHCHGSWQRFRPEGTSPADPGDCGRLPSSPRMVEYGARAC